jgi:hypothetical protein
MFTTYVGLSPNWGYVRPFCARGQAIFSLGFLFSWYGLGWYRVRVETPQEDICFFFGMEWEFGGGGGSFLGWYGVGKFRFFLLQIQKKLTKIWKFLPNSKKRKIGQN